MNLELLNSGTPDTKPWLNPVCNNLDVKTIFGLGFNFSRVA